MESVKLLGREIGYLISLQQEGRYWDFKRQWYTNKAVMLHNIMDTNTPKNRTADINNMEYLLRKRFYIDEMPITKFEHYLSKPDD